MQGLSMSGLQALFMVIVGGIFNGFYYDLAKRL
jgi:hypothetical protein